MTLLLPLWQDERIPVAQIMWTLYRLWHDHSDRRHYQIIKQHWTGVFVFSVLVMSMLQSCYNMLAACVMSPPAAAQTPLSSRVMTIRGYFNKTASITISNTRARVTGTRRKCSCSQEPREKWGEWERNDFHLVIRFLFPWIISARAAWQLGERAGRTMWPIHDHGNRKLPILTWTTYIFRSSQNWEYLTVIRCRGCSWSFTSRHQAQVIL